MKISFWIPAIVLYVVRIAFSNSVNVGTVLFTTTDLVKKCWTETDKSLLKARMIMQDILPDPSYIDFSESDAAMVLLDYFHACFQVINKSTYGKLQNLMYVALSDVLGGYLKAYVLPYTRKAFYAGEIKYSDAKKLFQLYEDIKIFLRTSGRGWAEPTKICYKRLRVKPIPITGGSLEACNQLYTIELQGRLHCINPARKCWEEIEFLKNWKESFQEDDTEFPWQEKQVFNVSRSKTPCMNQEPDLSSFHNETSDPHITDMKSVRLRHGNDNTKCRRDLGRRKCSPLGGKRVIIPLPMLDDCNNPHSIAVPFRKRPFRSLAGDSSAYILEYYYLAVIKCFIAKGNTRTDIKNFNSQFHCWMVTTVLPHLNDEKWYPAFGGVLRVMETIRKFGAETTVKDPILHDIAYLFSSAVDFDVTNSPKLTGREKTRDVTGLEDYDRSAKRHYLTAVLVASLIWIFIFCICVFYLQATRGYYLLYEGCSDRSLPSKSRRPMRRESRNINFEFLVKFFKRNECPQDDTVYHCVLEDEKQNVTKALLDSKTKYNQGKSEITQQKQEGKGKLVMAEHGEFPTFVISQPGELQQSRFPQPWTYLLPVGEEEAGRQVGEYGEGEDKVQMLWKNPSVDIKGPVSPKDLDREAKKRFEWTMKRTSTGTETSTTEDFVETSSHTCSASVEDETKGSSTDRRSSSCCCSETSQHSNTTATKFHSESQVEEKISSATMEFFDKVIARHKGYKGKKSKRTIKGHKDRKNPKDHKGYKKPPPQESTSESDSENGSDYSSESDN